MPSIFTITTPRPDPRPNQDRTQDPTKTRYTISTCLKCPNLRCCLRRCPNLCAKWTLKNAKDVVAPPRPTCQKNVRDVICYFPSKRIERTTGVANVQNDVRCVAQWQEAIVPRIALVVVVHMCRQLCSDYKCKDVNVIFFSFQTCNTLVCIWLY